MALFKLRKAKDEFLMEALSAGRLVINQRFPQVCSPRMPLNILHKIMADGFLFYDKVPEVIKPEPIVKTEFTPRDVIIHSAYGEFPDAIVTIKLARRVAEMDGRSMEEAMRNCAGLIAGRTMNQKLRFLLLDMVVCKYPDNHLVDIQKTYKLMAKHLRGELGDVIHAPSEAALAGMLQQKRKNPLPFQRK